ncbi:MAG: hypothetical protein AMXMBFR33_23380 [Candidatus Xenobia bacterium]
MDLFFWLDDFLRSRTPRAGWSLYAIESLRVFVLILSTALLAYVLVDNFHVQLHLPG